MPETVCLIAERTPQVRRILSAAAERAGFGTIAAENERDLIRATCDLARLQAEVKLILASDQLASGPWIELVATIARRSHRFCERVLAVFIVEPGVTRLLPDLRPCEVIGVMEPPLEVDVFAAVLAMLTTAALQEGPDSRPSGIYRI